jgi:CubicO group peptidase (beta-lactamase class C family)
MIWAIVAAGCGSSSTHPEPPPGPLDEVWGTEPAFGPALAGTLRVGRDRTADIAAVSAVLRDDRDEWRGTFAPSGAEVRLRVDGPRLRGFWIQPPGIVLQTAYATPLVLEPTADGWVGQVQPLVDRLRMYMTMRGKTAWIREIETNVGRMFGTLSVSTTKDRIELRKQDGELVFTGRAAPDGLDLRMAMVGLDLVLTRRTRESLYPRTNGDRVATRPPPAADAWPTATLEDVGLERAPIAALVERIATTVQTEATSPAIHSLLIARHGKLVLEQYFAGYTRDDVHDLRSAGKSITTTLLGIAGDQQLVRPDDLVADTLGHVANDPRRDALRLRHLASMSSGLECDDDDEGSRGNEDVMQQQHDVTDWYRYTWSLPFIRDPGEKAVYCTGAINLIGAVLARKTGRWLPELFDAWIARPLDITAYHWNLMPTGEGYLGGGARLRPRDFAKLAQLVVGRGTWLGRRVVSEAWIATATAAHASINTEHDYGFGWWRRRYQVADRAIDIVYASGNGAQLAIAVPQLDLVISVTTGNYGQGAIRRQILDTWVPMILAAADAPK